MFNDYNTDSAKRFEGRQAVKRLLVFGDALRQGDACSEKLDAHVTTLSDGAGPSAVSGGVCLSRVPRVLSRLAPDWRCHPVGSIGGGERSLVGLVG